MAFLVMLAVFAPFYVLQLDWYVLLPVAAFALVYLAPEWRDLRNEMRVLRCKGF